MEYAWLIPLLPLLAFPTIIFFGKRLPGKGSSVSIAAVGIGFVLSCFILGAMMKAPETVHRANIGWLSLGPIEFRMGILVDGLTAVMLFVVTLVSMLVQIYSLGYMHGDPRFSRFYVYLSLFTFAMLGLVVADNFMLLFICWELVGVCSYFLIGFWFEKKSASDAGKKAFLTTKIGDIAFFIGILTLFSVFKTFSFEEIAEGVAAGNISAGLLTAAAVLVFGGAVGKSAQFPLHVWLPDAMEGPTPVSALIHAATMVAAGVYLVARAYGIFAPSPEALHVVAYIGIITAFIAATIAVVNNDIKRVLAYSTVSQLGYMMMALGVGGYTAGMFHLTTHAFFKALLFLGAGSVIHATHCQDIREMGGLLKPMKITGWTFLMACISIAGIWPFSGFYSKDEILLDAYKSGNMLIYGAGTFVAFLTAFYMFRLFFLTFTGEPRKKESHGHNSHGHESHHVHESPANMTVPLIILAVLSVVAGRLLLIHDVFPHMVHWGEAHHGGHGAEGHGHSPEALVMTISLCVASLGIILAWAIYHKRWLSPQPWVERVAPLALVHKFLYNKWYFDEVYLACFVRPTLALSRGLFKFDLGVIDGLVNGSALLTVLISKLKGLFDNWVVDGLVNLVGNIVIWVGTAARRVQTGLVQNYLCAVLVIVGVLIVVQFVQRLM